jgi:hypothetical protein
MALHVPAVELAVDGAASFYVDVPAETVAGTLNQPWSVDIPVEIAGQALRFSEAWLTETSSILQLVLRSDPLGAPGDRFLTGLRLAAIIGPDGQPLNLALAHSGAGPGFFSPVRDYVAVVIIPVNNAGGPQVQRGRYQVELGGVILGVRGPWVLTWDLPGP